MSKTTSVAAASADKFNDDTLALLEAPLRLETDLARSFLNSLKGDLVHDMIKERDTFAGILHFAIDRGMVHQDVLAERLHYANSQVGRWAAGKAAPPYIVRRNVIEEICTIIEANLDEARPINLRRHARA